MKQRYLGAWHEQQIMVIGDIFRAALLDAVQKADQLYTESTGKRQIRLEELYGGEKVRVMVGLMRDAGKRVGVVFLGLEVQPSPIPDRDTDSLPAISLSELIQEDDDNLLP